MLLDRPGTEGDICHFEPMASLKKTHCPSPPPTFSPTDLLVFFFPPFFLRLWQDPSPALELEAKERTGTAPKRKRTVEGVLSACSVDVRLKVDEGRACVLRGKTSRKVQIVLRI